MISVVNMVCGVNVISVIIQVIGITMAIDSYSVPIKEWLCFDQFHVFFFASPNNGHYYLALIYFFLRL